MYAAENPKFSAEIAGKQSFFCFGKCSSELVKKQFGQAWCETWGSVALVLCCPCTNVNQGQYRTKSVWRLCTPSACKFPVIFHKNAREYIQYSLRFLFHLTKNLTTHLSHNLCAVLPWKTLHQARLTVLLICVSLVRTMLTAIFYKCCLFYFCFCVIFMMQPYGVFFVTPFTIE